MSPILYDEETGRRLIKPRYVWALWGFVAGVAVTTIFWYLV